MTSNRNFFDKLEDNFLKYKKNKLDEKMSHEEFTKMLPEQIEEINSAFVTLINLIDAMETSDQELKNTIKGRTRKLYRKVQRIMSMHEQEEQSEESGEDPNALEIDTEPSESIEEMSSGAGGGVQGSPGTNNSNVNSRYGSKKINIKRFKQEKE